MTDQELVIKYIEKAGVSEAARTLGIARPTVYVRLKNPDTVTLKELKIVKSMSNGEEPEQVEEKPKYVTVFPPADPELVIPKDPPTQTIEAPTLPEMRFKPSSLRPKGAPGLTLEEAFSRINRLEEYLKIVTQNKNLQSGKPTVGEAIPGTRIMVAGENPIAQLQRQGNPQDAPRPKGLRPDSDAGWNTPKSYNRDNRP